MSENKCILFSKKYYFCFLFCFLKEGEDLAFVANEKIKVKMKNFRTLKT